MGASKPEEYGYYFWWGDTLGCRRDGDAWVSSNGSITSFQFCSKSGRARSDVSDDALRTFTVIELSAGLCLNYGEAMWYHTDV